MEIYVTSIADLRGKKMVSEISFLPRATPKYIRSVVCSIPGVHRTLDVVENKPLRWIGPGYFTANVSLTGAFSMFDPISLMGSGVGVMNDLIIFAGGDGGNQNERTERQIHRAQKFERSGQYLTALSGIGYIASGHYIGGVCTISGALIGRLNKPRKKPSSMADASKALKELKLKQAVSHLCAVPPYQKSALVWTFGSLYAFLPLLFTVQNPITIALVSVALVGHMISNRLVYISQKAEAKRSRTNKQKQRVDPFNKK